VPKLRLLEITRSWRGDETATGIPTGVAELWTAPMCSQLEEITLAAGPHRIVVEGLAATTIRRATLLGRDARRSWTCRFERAEDGTLSRLEITTMPYHDVWSSDESLAELAELPPTALTAVHVEWGHAQTRKAYRTKLVALLERQQRLVAPPSYASKP
jgi:hypothetical protein